MAQQHPLFHKAQKAFSAGKHGQAEKHLRKLLKSKELYVPARILLSKVLIAQNKAAEAAERLSEAAKQQSDNTALWKATGEIYAKLGNHEKAILHLEQAVSQTPHSPDLWVALLQSMLQSYTQSPNPTQQALSDLLALSTKAVELFSNNLELIHLAGEICFTAKLYEPAAQYLEACLTATPLNIPAHRRWLEIQYLHENDRAILAYAEQHARKVPSDHLCNRVISAAYEKNGRITEARDHIEIALALNPNNIDYIASKGRILYHAGHFSQALTFLDKAIALEPELVSARVNRGLVQKKLGNISAAAKDEKYRLEVADNNPKFKLSAPMWDGSDLGEQRLFIWSDQGIGDVFKYALLINELDYKEGQLILCTQNKLVPFLKHVFPNIEIRPFPNYGTPTSQNKQAPSSPIFEQIEEDFDCHIPIGLLYGHLRPSLDIFKDKKTEFTIDETIIQQTLKLDILSNPNTTKVGVAWSSKNSNPLVERNYLKLEELLPIFRLSGFEFYNFQYDASEDEINQFRKAHNVPLYHAPNLDLFDDLFHTAALNKCMDLFISPANSCSDLAGSLGIKSLRLDLEHLPENLGQDFIPWYKDQKCLSIPYQSTIHDFFPQIQQWLLDNKNHKRH